MGIALFALVVLLQVFSLIAFCLNREMSIEIQNWQLGIAVVFSALYSASSAAILFCNEHEEKTFSFLRSLPVSRSSVLLGKLTWMLGSSLAFLLAVLLWTGLIHLLFIGTEFNIDLNEAVFPILWFTFGCIVCPICWGLFWTTTLRSQLHSLLAVFISAAFTFWSSYQVGHLDIVEKGGWGPAVFIMIFVGTTLLAGIDGLLCGYRWFDLWRDKGNKFTDFRTTAEETAEVLAAHYTLARTSVVKKRGEFLSLCFQALGQQRTLFLWTYGSALVSWAVFCVILLVGLLVPGLVRIVAKSLGEEVVGVIFWTWIAVLFVLAFVYCGGVFSGDQKTRAAFLAERGISPDKIWWSRVLTFVIPWLAVVSLWILTIVAVYWYLSVTQGWQRETWDRVTWGLGLALLYAVPPIFAGIYASLFVRSPIVSVIATMGLYYALMCWGVIMIGYLGLWTCINGHLYLIPTPLWSVVPLFLAVVAASRLRMDDWLRGRSLWRSRRPVLLTVLLTFAAICVVIPFYRVYTIPKIDYGYRADPLVLTADFQCKEPEYIVHGDNSWDYVRFAPDIKTLQERWEIVNRAFTDPSQANFANSHLNVESEVIYGLSNLLLRQSKGDRNIPESERPIVVENVDPVFLDEALELLKLIDARRVPLTERLKRVYEESHRFGLKPTADRWGGDTWQVVLLFRVLPWERQRYLRENDYQFQVHSSFAEQTERIVFHGNGDSVSYWNSYWNSYDKAFWRAVYELQWSLPFRPMPESWNSNLCQVYTTELTRRATILKFALIKYMQEHGELPATLDELQTSGILAEIPQIPYTNKTFFYDPKPDGTEGDGGPYGDRRHKPGTPYLWGSNLGSTQDKPDTIRQNGFWFDLNFQRVGNRASGIGR